ncbi:hypothetical protein GSI_10548 [Ganoderma sinense ZZ0214-1]|uniref:Uncharacterized protein n=1 Tax=Ganoderma sinense ZZ0214-1 TaxID=1077348 RepID=A0A2G8S0V3_9APHY|nr:hypothetical protein GSI_10548 [Ganoderma sinense ZZ0214-1]
MAVTITPKAEPQDPSLPHPTLKAAPPALQAVDNEARQAALENISKDRRAQAWPIARWPLEKRVAHERTRVHLPRTYLARHGSDVRAVYPGTDIDQLVHRHYCERVAREEQDREKAMLEAEGKVLVMEGCPNYVGAEGILARRHEYLGPDPRVVGYFVDAAGEYHVKFYDTFLGDQWMDNRKWAFDVRQDEDGKWVDAAE